MKSEWRTEYYSVDNKSKYVFQELRIRLKHFKVYRNFKRRSNRILEHLVEVTRKRAKRNSTPSYALIDSQSAKTVYASEQIDYDGGKKTKEESGIS